MSHTRRCPEQDSDGEEIVVGIRVFIVLTLAMLAVSACVVEPVGGTYGGGHGYYNSGHGYNGAGHERGVWRG